MAAAETFRDYSGLVRCRVKALVLSPEIVPIVILVVLLSIACKAFFGHYAFDDSYIGYSIAKSLIAGHGFTFNVSEPLLSTSAPLAVPIYAAISVAFNVTIVSIAQVLAALSLAIIAFGSYALARIIAPPIGALIAAVIGTFSPFILLLWSHETLLYIATLMIAANLYARRYVNAASFLLGCATLFRGEGMLLLPFLWICEMRRGGTRAFARCTVLSSLPYTIWAITATLYFGGFLSETIAAKQTQIAYGNPDYLSGLLIFLSYTYKLTNTTLWPLAAIAASVICCLMAVIASRLPLVIFFWAILTTLLYILLRLPFYFWFAGQFPIAIAAACAVVWSHPPGIPSSVISVGRGAAIVVAGLNISFLLMQIADADARNHYPGVVMPQVQNNEYKYLGMWFARQARPGETISYAEIGQLRYYSEHDVVDFLGLATPDAAAHLNNNDAIWTFKRYKPTWYADAKFHVYVDPLQYDWFRSAYRRIAVMHFPDSDVTRNTVAIYKLKNAADIPQAEARDKGLKLRGLVTRKNGFGIEIVPSVNGVDSLDFGLLHTAACKRIVVTLRRGNAFVAARNESLTDAPSFSRVSLSFEPISRSGRYQLDVKGCSGLRIARPRIGAYAGLWPNGVLAVTEDLGTGTISAYFKA